MESALFVRKGNARLARWSFDKQVAEYASYKYPSTQQIMSSASGGENFKEITKSDTRAYEPADFHNLSSGGRGDFPRWCPKKLEARDVVNPDGIWHHWSLKSYRCGTDSLKLTNWMRHVMEHSIRTRADKFVRYSEVSNVSKRHFQELINKVDGIIDQVVLL